MPDLNYNLSFTDHQSSFVGLIEGLNTATNDWFFGIVLLVAWLVMFLALYNRTDTDNLLIGSGFIFSIIAGLSMGAGIMPVWIVSVPVTITAAGIMMKYMGGR